MTDALRVCDIYVELLMYEYNAQERRSTNLRLSNLIFSQYLHAPGPKKHHKLTPALNDSTDTPTNLCDLRVGLLNYMEQWYMRQTKVWKLLDGDTMEVSTKHFVVRHRHKTLISTYTSLFWNSILLQNREWQPKSYRELEIPRMGLFGCRNFANYIFHRWKWNVKHFIIRKLKIGAIIGTIIDTLEISEYSRKDELFTDLKQEVMLASPAMWHNLALDV